MELRNFTITKKNFLDFYWNTGADQDQEKMIRDLGYDIVQNALKGELVYIMDVQELFNGCEYIRMSDCEEVTENHPYYDMEMLDVEKEFGEINIKLI